MQIYIARLQKFSDALTAENKNVFSFAAKVQTVQFNIRSSGGRLFHTRGPATAKFLAPMVVRVRGTYRTTGFWCRRTAADVDQPRTTQARPSRHLKTISASLNRTRSAMGSQWSSFSTVMWSNFLDRDTTRAAAFCTVCSFLSS